MVHRFFVLPETAREFKSGIAGKLRAWRALVAEGGAYAPASGIDDGRVVF